MTTTMTTRPMVRDTLRVRRGLPRTPHGEPWPPVDSAILPPASVPTVTVTETPPATVDSAPVPEMTEVHLRRGLPRRPGEKFWPPENVSVKAVAPVPDTTVPVPQSAVSASHTDAPVLDATALVPRTAPSPSPEISHVTETVTLRRGLPRVPGGEPWPEVADIEIAVASATASATADLTEKPEATHPVDVVEQVKETTHAPIIEPTPPTTSEKPEPKRYGPFTLAQWIGGGVIVVVSLIAVTAVVVLGVRWFLATETGTEFTTAYPGEAPMPDNAPVGVPAWLAWSHFFNLFLMVLIIRSGLQIRSERRPPAYWSSRGGAGRKISLTTWFHQSLDLLWVINGALFIILLFATGQWMRLVPTSWEVLPNALSAGLQYLSLDWPTENGWVHYNGLQQLAYFLTIFIAAPLAVITGIRMSGLWPAKMKKLSALYPVEVARKLHFPVMLYFVFFIFAHVLLVFATGALRNLNHMFAAQGSTDPAVYADNWTGFWLFVLGMVVIAAAWVAARPIVLAPVARLFGTVSNR